MTSVCRGRVASGRAPVHAPLESSSLELERERGARDNQHAVLVVKFSMPFATVENMSRTSAVTRRRASARVARSSTSPRPEKIKRCTGHRAEKRAGPARALRVRPLAHSRRAGGGRRSASGRARARSRFTTGHSTHERTVYSPTALTEYVAYVNKNKTTHTETYKARCRSRDLAAPRVRDQSRVSDSPAPWLELADHPVQVGPKVHARRLAHVARHADTVAQVGEAG